MNGYFEGPLPLFSNILGDVNGDGFVASDDLITALTWWGRSGMDRVHGDLNQDGLVGVDDYVEVLSNWGNGAPPSPPPEPIPELNAMGFLLIGGFVSVWLRRR